MKTSLTGKKYVEFTKQTTMSYTDYAKWPRILIEMDDNPLGQAAVVCISRSGQQEQTELFLMKRPTMIIFKAVYNTIGGRTMSSLDLQ